MLKGVIFGTHRGGMDLDHSLISFGPWIWNFDQFCLPMTWNNCFLHKKPSSLQNEDNKKR